MDKPQHVIFVVADSLRYDSVWKDSDAQLPRLTENSTTFHQAYSAGCWTLPSHGSMFTGLLPHQHGATTRSRGIRDDVQTLAEYMGDQGYETVQLTANTVTTHIFGLDRGFDRVERIWKTLDPGNVPLSNIMVLLGKRRIRDKFLKGDFIAGKMTEDIKAGQTWVRSFGQGQFDLAKDILKEADEKNKKVFLFINLMETHFPYHIQSKFKTLSSHPVAKFRELKSLYHLVNQSWLTADKDYINAKMLELIRERQKLAWQRFAEQIDTFSDYITGNYPESLYIFTSDHGDNFGDEGWKYHFSNVTEAGNRVPLFMSGAGFAKQKSVDTPVSIRFINDTIRDAASDGLNTESIYGKGHFSPVLESFWYNRKGKTLSKYRHDQFAFIADKHRYVKNGDGWHVFELGNGDSANVEEIPYHSNPIYDVSLPKEQRDDLINNFDEFITFSNSLEN